MTAVKTFQLFLVLRDFVTTQSLITVYLILSGDMNPSPAKGNPTWNLGNEMWLGKEAGQGM